MTVTAQREVLADGRERWRLPAGQEALARELLALGALGLGGFVEGGEEEGGGSWLIREAATRTLSEALERWDRRAGGDGDGDGGGDGAWVEVVTSLAGVARRLAAAEARGLFPGSLRPDEVVCSPSQEGAPWLRADALISTSLGAPSCEGGGTSEGGGGQLRREWLTPSAAEGRPADASDNRWLLGLLLYRGLAGHGPFAGMGLRAAIEQLERGVPPLPEAVAAGLPPGLHSALLRMLDADPQRRPASAEALVELLEGALAGEVARADPREHVDPKTALRERRARVQAAANPPAPTRTSTSQAPTCASTSPAPTRASKPGASRPAAPRRRWSATRLSGALVLVALGIAGGLGLLEWAAPPVDSSTATASKPPPGVEVGARGPLDAAHTSPEDCAGCHPRQSAEWKRSVMGHSAKSPLFQALEILIEEQVGRSDDCPGGAGILRGADSRTACRDPNTGIAITGAGGALWCANCHTPRENLGASLPAWDGLGAGAGAQASRRPLRDLQPASTTEGIDCGFCHQVHGPVEIGGARLGGYEGNPSWISTATGRTFFMRPEDRVGAAGIANSGYQLDPGELLAVDLLEPSAADDGRTDPLAALDRERVPGGIHRRPSDDARAYLQSSRFCGACHDVRLFGSDAVGTPTRGEHFRRLRNAYSEWAAWAADERRAGRTPADCQDCHMSSFPGICVEGEASAPVPGETDPSALRRGCPPGTHFESRRPGERPLTRVAAGSGERRELSTHYFSGVDIPLTPEFDARYVDQPELDAAGIPLGGRQRRDLLLGRSFRFELDGAAARIVGRRLELPIELENTGAGHKIPAGFSQEREFWVHLKVSDASGRILYEVGRVDRGDEDLRDKLFVRVNVDDRLRDGAGRPLGLFGADVVDGPDRPQWRALDGNPRSEHQQPAPTRFRGRGLINLQNGFLRCVQCIGFIDGEGRCQAANAAQAATRAGRYADGGFDDDTGLCSSNLGGDEALFETYFPVGSLDASRGVVKGPDAIIDVRSAPPGVAMRWIYELELPADVRGPITVEARLLFRAFPPFLIRAFADYEALQAARGLRPSGALVTREMLDELEVVELAAVSQTLAP
ncbi:hypothetical protein G6O69_17000 [Pseudenhygromyxa sp. WMMC2535]|nr:hypothetical protein [Pseudenhygromyxa sp. WMMC2535]